MEADRCTGESTSSIDSTGQQEGGNAMNVMSFIYYLYVYIESIC
jgi:hypothetical protein